MYVQVPVPDGAAALQAGRGDAALPARGRSLAAPEAGEVHTHIHVHI